MKTRSVMAMTMIEALVVIALLVLLAAVLLPALAVAKRKSARIGCINNIKEINLAFKIWSGDNGDKLPMQFYATNDIMMKSVTNGNAWILWQTISNELSTPKILHCPDDSGHVATTNFAQSFSDTNISYFFNLDSADVAPQMILDGDDNLVVNGLRATSGILSLQTNSPVSWTKDRHLGSGNIGLADGSVMQVSSKGLSSAMAGSSTNTVRLVIP